MQDVFVIEYLKSIAEKYHTGQAKEHAYRPALQKLFGDITGLNVVNDPKRSEYGAPDFVFMKGKVAAAYAEAKDIGISLDETEKGEQLVRYFGYSNLILTDCLEFRFFRNGQKYETVKIAEIKGGEIIGDENNFSHLEDTIKEFIQEAKEPIKSGKILAKVMAGKARRIRDNIKKFLNEDDKEKNSSLLAVYDAIKKLLLVDLDYDKFADMYAQTVVYGLFVARYHDDTLEDFSRQEARDLVPKSNPFLRKFFDHIAGEDFDKRIEFIVNELCEEFVHADVQAIVQDYYKVEKDDSRDPIIHFYEDFLQEYDPLERKKMGVFYTPLPVVRFIVRAIDDVLKKEFGLNGLADTSKVEIQGIQGEKKKQTVHKVQILDPATGTGTFLNEVITHVKKSFTGQEGRWANYAREDLLPRLHGFEIMMASYTIAHLKLSATLKESGVDIDKGRLGVYLTNSLEKAETYDDTLFAYGLGLSQAITDESIAANKVKNDLPIMVVLGNPPYSGESNNKFENANKLIDKYKFEPGGIEKLKERNPKWLNDDYVKFIAFAEDLIIKNNEGVLGFITNHSYLDNPTFRGMRWRLAQTFDEIYILDLHGNAKKKEQHPDGNKDENIFAIQQGVAIMVGVKKKKRGIKKDAKVFVADVYGTKTVKFETLDNNNIKYTEIKLDPQQYYFVNKNIEGKDEYDKGFYINDLFNVSNVGIVTSADSILIASSKEKLLRQLYKAKEENSSKKTIQKLKNEIIEESKIQKISYRPFDNQYIYYEPKVIERARYEVMKHLIDGENVGLVFVQRSPLKTPVSYYFLTSNIISNGYIRSDSVSIDNVVPLYLYADDGTKVPNLDKEIWKKIDEVAGKTEPENILDYIYAVLHSPNYREKYKEFLKIDFPRVPYPKDEKQFFALAKLGEELRHLHLLESSTVNNLITTYPVVGDNLVEKITYQEEKVFINKTQYFGGVPQSAWDFYIGGYQP
ncbi:N-6 DNA methylase, partial [Patescibacteria group bacterium]|nr:N-6 DNA methylase [Patescibacteria group bacterium]